MDFGNSALGLLSMCNTATLFYKDKHVFLSRMYVSYVHELF